MWQKSASNLYFTYHWQKITPKSSKSFVKRNLFQFVLLYLHHKYCEYRSKEVESVKLLFLA